MDNPNYTTAKRSRGRPKTRWEDDLNAFAQFIGYQSWIAYAESQDEADWKMQTNDFINYILSPEN